MLGIYTLDNNSTLTLSSEANGYVIADGVKLVTTTTDTSSGVYYVHNDHLGTPQTLTDNNQDIVWAAAYDPFGKATVTTETVTNNVRFPGQYFDQETGLHYNYFRTYDPSTGRYITSDPIGLYGGINTYGYVGQNSITRTDPTGENTIVLGGEIGFTIGGPPGAVVGAVIGGAIGVGIYLMCSDDTEDRDEICEENLERDLKTCTAVGKRDGKSAYKICEGQAYARYSRCLQGSDITPPLPPWGTK